MKIIPLTQGKVTFVDDEDYEFLLNFGSWFTLFDGRRHYAMRDNPHMLMHRVIMERIKPGFKNQVDHIDGNGHNNWRLNLRTATNSQNQANRGPNNNNISGYKGVSREQRNQKWKTQIMYQGIKSHLGYFNTPEKAARAYDFAAWSLWKDYSRLNFPEELEK